ncbi:hypothetical protein D4S03_09290 [bacterium]|nr:MAG: hypothetical protein D4S03_09290 [bacterium]
MPDPGSSPGQALIRHPVQFWIPAPRFHGGKFIPAKAGTGMTALTYIVARVLRIKTGAGNGEKPTGG